MIKLMVKDLLNGLMGMNMKENIKIIFKMEKVYLNMLMEINMKGNG